MARVFGVICGALLASICLLSTLFAETASGLLEQFENTTVFWEQFLVAKKIVALHDKSVLPHLPIAALISGRLSRRSDGA